MNHLDPANLSTPADLTALDMAAIREARASVGRLESDLSFARRIVQGRLDIVQAERMRRAQGHAPSDLTELIASLPTVLASGVEGTHSTGGRSFVEPSNAITFEADEIIDAVALAALPASSDERLSEIAAGLERLERSLSDRRRTAQLSFDALSAEVVRRFRSGEVSIDSVT